MATVAASGANEPLGAPAGSAKNNVSFPLPPLRNSSVLLGPSTKGTRVRSHCFVASTAMRRRRSSRAGDESAATCARWERSASSSTKPAAPHSVPFSIAHSTRAGSAHASSTVTRFAGSPGREEEEEEKAEEEIFLEGKRAKAEPLRVSVARSRRPFPSSATTSSPSLRRLERTWSRSSTFKEIVRFSSDLPAYSAKSGTYTRGGRAGAFSAIRRNPG